jgi:hypothetical protein
MDFLTGMPPEPKAGGKSQDHNATKYKSMTESQWVSHPSPIPANDTLFRSC